MSSDSVDVRTRFVVYRDITEGEMTEMSGWFTDTASAVKYLDSIKASGGGDGPETVFDGIGQVFSRSFGYRADTAKFCVVLTDADYKLDNNRGIKSEDEVITRLTARISILLL